MKKKEVLEMANFVWKRYEELHASIEFWQLLSLLDRNINRVVFIKNKDSLAGVATYMKVSDDSLIKLINGEININDKEQMYNLLQENGNNIYFIFVVANDMKTIRRGLLKVIRTENPDSVFWLGRQTLVPKIFRIRGELCNI